MKRCARLRFPFARSPAASATRPCRPRRLGRPAGERAPRCPPNVLAGRCHGLPRARRPNGSARVAGRHGRPGGGAARRHLGPQRGSSLESRPAFRAPRLAIRTSSAEAVRWRLPRPHTTAVRPVPPWARGGGRPRMWSGGHTNAARPDHRLPGCRVAVPLHVLRRWSAHCRPPVAPVRPLVGRNRPLVENGAPIAPAAVTLSGSVRHQRSNSPKIRTPALHQ